MLMLAPPAEAAVDAGAVTPWWQVLIGILTVGLLAGYVFFVVLGLFHSSMTGSDPWLRKTHEEPPQENSKNQENP